MPLIVKCKKCGRIIKIITDPDVFAKFDIALFEGKKCKCGHIFHIKNAEYSIVPLTTIKKSSEETKEQQLEVKIFTLKRRLWSQKRRRRVCKYCGKEFKVGDVIASIGEGRKGLKRFHLECYKKFQEQEIIVVPFSKVEEIT